MIYSLLGFYLNWRAYNFFGEGHPRRWEVTLTLWHRKANGTDLSMTWFTIYKRSLRQYWDWEKSIKIATKMVKQNLKGLVPFFVLSNHLNASNSLMLVCFSFLYHLANVGQYSRLIYHAFSVARNYSFYSLLIMISLNFLTPFVSCKGKKAFPKEKYQ